MHVLIIHQNFVDHKHPGGTRHLDVGADLVRKGHEVTIVASNVDYLTGTQIPSSGEEVYQGVRVVRAYGLPTVQKGFVWRVLSYLSFVPSSCWAAMKIKDVDLVLGTTPPIFQLPPTWLVAVLRRKPWVLEVLDLWPDFAIGLGVLKNRFLIWLCRAAERFFYRRADYCVVNAPAYADHVERFGVPRENITFIPMGVDLQLFDSEETGANFRHQHQLEDKFVVMYAGSLSLANDLDTFLVAADRLRHETAIQFVLAGGGNQVERLKTIVEEKQLSNVTFAGHFAKGEVGRVLAAADVCVATLMDIPEFKMPFPNKVFDYMAAGKPILLGIDGAIRKVVEDANAGIFITPSDGESLATGVMSLKNDPALREQMSRSGRRCCEEHYDIRFQADKFEQVFAKATAR
jgi:glycosyltransferase involved in cell wall biosynthesis